MSTTHDFFTEHGYFHAPGVFQGKELETLQAAFDQCCEQLTTTNEETNARWDSVAQLVPEAANTTVMHTHNVERYDARWHHAITQPKLLDLCQDILGPNIILHHTKLFQKPPETGAPFPLHQDWGYFPISNDQMIAAVIHLSDADDDMGCLRIVPGSHKLGRITGSMTGAADEQSNAFHQSWPFAKSTPCPCKAGDVVFFHYLTIHGSLPNRSPHTRKTVLIQMHDGHGQLEREAHTYSGLVLRGRNYTMSRSQAATLKQH